MNLQQLSDRARYLALITTENLAPTTQTYALINECYRDICAQRDWTFMQAKTSLALVAGTAGYPLPTGIRTIRSISIPATSNETGRLLEPRSESEMDQLPYGTERNRPEFYSLSTESTGEVLTFYPTPKEPVTIILRGWSTVAPLVALTDTPVFREEYHHVLAYEAAARHMAREGEDMEQVGEYRNIVNQILSRMNQDYMTIRDQSPLVMSGRKTRRSYTPFSNRRF